MYDPNKPNPAAGSNENTANASGGTPPDDAAAAAPGAAPAEPSGPAPGAPAAGTPPPILPAAPAAPTAAAAPGGTPPQSAPSAPAASYTAPTGPPPGAPSGPPPAAPGGGKKSPLVWILGGCGGCGCIGLILMLVLGGSCLRTVRDIEKGAQQGARGTQQGTGTQQDTPAAAAADMETFTATRDNTSAKFAENYVPFSFQYPRTWQVMPDESNFIKVEEREGNFTFENFAVGSVTIPAEADNNVVYPALMSQLSQSFAQNFPNFQEIAQVPEDVGGYRGRSMSWQARMTGTPRGDVDFYGRVLLVREPGQSRGVALIMIATSLDPEVKSPADVGVKGDLARILPTFRLGSAAGATNSEGTTGADDTGATEGTSETGTGASDDQ